VHGFVISRLDYCNGTLASLPTRLLGQLQRVLNAAATCIGTPATWPYQASTVRTSLAVSALEDTIQTVSVNALCYCSVLSKLHQQHCSEHCCLISTTRLRSSTENLSHTVQPARTKLGERAFSVTGPIAWNSLPYDIRKITDINTFKRHLKVYFFHHYFFMQA